ncbi:MAG TPA: response regulator [Methylomirabilota bacterium]|nr:response regulator [Methylomirabilota bacterium]
MRPLPSVLLVDDNLDTLQTLSSIMAALGAKRVREAQSAESALEILRNESFTMIVSDYRMDGMDGVEFVEQLRSQGHATPVLVVSGAPDKQGVLRATRHERVDFWGKPFSVGELMGAVDRLMAA